MSVMTTSAARKDFAGTLKRVRRGERIRLESHGKPVAAIVSLEDLALIEEIEDRLDRRAAQTAKAEADRDGTTSWEQIKADRGL